MTDKLEIEISDLFWKNPTTGYFELIEFIVKKKGIWEFHKYDQDPLPSKPHGHNRETGEKLNIYNGRRYDPVTKKCTGILDENTLSKTGIN